MGRLTHLLQNSCSLYRKSLTPNLRGGFVESLEPVTDSNGPIVLKCRINPAGTRDLLIAQQTNAEVDHVFYFDPSQTPTLLVNDVLVSGGRSFRIIIPKIVPSLESLYLKSLAVEIQ